MNEDEKALLYNLRSLARMEHADLSIGDEAADTIKRLVRERDEAQDANSQLIDQLRCENEAYRSQRDEAWTEIERMREALQISVDELLATIDAALAPATPPAQKDAAP